MRPSGFHHTVETKQKMSINHGRWNAGLTKETDARLARQSKSLSEHWKTVPPRKGMKGKTHSLETRLKMSMMRTGCKNANWKGGVTEGVRLFRKSRRYQQWRREVLAKNQYQCIICREKAIIAHHIKPIKLYPEFRFEINNGMAVCCLCHRKIHRKENQYAKDNN